MTIDNITAAEIFEGAVEVINDRGWTQGTLRSASGAVCAVGAVCEAIKESPILFRGLVGKSIFFDINEEGFMEINDDRKGISTIPSWNDMPHRTKEDVIDKFMES